RRCVEQGPLRVPLGGPVQPLARPGYGALHARRDAAQGRPQGRALLLHVRPQVLLDGDYAAGAGLRGEAERARRGAGQGHDGGGPGGRHGGDEPEVPRHGRGGICGRRQGEGGEQGAGVARAGDPSGLTTWLQPTPSFRASTRTESAFATCGIGKLSVERTNRLRSSNERPRPDYQVCPTIGTAYCRYG